MVLNTENIDSTATIVAALVELGLAWRFLLDIGTAAAVVASCLCFVGAFEGSAATEYKQFAVMAFASCSACLASTAAITTIPASASY